MITLLSGVSFAHIMFHAMMSAIIDRYAYPVYPLMLICLIILLMDKSTEKTQLQLVENNRKRSDKNEKKRNRKIESKN